MIDEYSQYYWYFPYNDITEFKNGTIHEHLSVNVWRCIIIIFLGLLITLIILTIYLCQDQRNEEVKVRKNKKSDKGCQNSTSSSCNFVYRCALENYDRNQHLSGKKIKKVIHCQNNKILPNYNKHLVNVPCDCMHGTKFCNSYIYKCSSNKHNINCNCICKTLTKQYLVVDENDCSIPSIKLCDHVLENEICKVNIEKSDSKDIKQVKREFKDAETSTNDFDCKIDEEDEYTKKKIYIFKC